MLRDEDTIPIIQDYLMFWSSCFLPEVSKPFLWRTKQPNSYFFFFFTTWHVASWFLDQRLQPVPPALGARSLNHWTTSKVPKLCGYFRLCRPYSLHYTTTQRYHYSIKEAIGNVYNEQVWQFPIKFMTIDSGKDLACRLQFADPCS